MARRASPAQKLKPPQSNERLRRRLARLVDSFLGLRIKTPDQFWQFELDLLALQRDIQSAITATRRVPKGAARQVQLDDLRETRWHARRLGDAIAWTLFDRKVRQILPLSYNAKVPVLPESHTATGLIAVAAAMAPAFGLPLLHDVTDILRIGDVTFFSSDMPPRTAEIKTSVGEATPVGDGTERLELKVTAIWTADQPMPSDVRDRLKLGPSKLASDTPTRSLAQPNARFGAQLKRLSRASSLREAVPGTPALIDGKKHLIIEARAPKRSSHWPLIKRVVRQARKVGYASGGADSAVIYIAAYNKPGLGPPDEFLASSGHDLVASGIFLANGNENRLRLFGLPDPRSDGPDRFLPWYLYPIPRAWITDILLGRLVILALVNEGRLAEALRAAGLRAEWPTSKDTCLRVFCEAAVQGGTVLVELAPLTDNFVEAIMEALPISTMVDMATSMADAIKEQLPAMMADAMSAG